MPIAIAQSVVGQFSATSGTTGNINTTNGSSFLLPCVYDGTFTSLADNKGNTIGAGQLIYAETETYSYKLRVYLVTAGNGGSSHNWTLTCSGAGACGVIPIEITGAATSSLLDQISIINDDGSAPLTSPSITTTQANELLIGLCMTNYSAGTESYTWGNSFGAVAGITNNALYWPLGVGSRIVGSTGTYNSECAIASGRAGQVVLSLKELVGGGGSSILRQMMMNH